MEGLGLIWRHFRAWLYLINIPKVSESKYQAGFGVIILGQNPLTFMIPIYSTTVLYDTLVLKILSDFVNWTNDVPFAMEFNLADHHKC